MLGLHFCARAFSSCGKWGPLFIAVRGPLTIAASPVAEHRLQTRRLSSCGSRAQLLPGMWDLPRPGLEPVSPALAGRFSTTAPPGKPFRLIFTIETELGVFTTDILPLVLLLLLPDDSCLFLHSFVPLRSLITEICSKASIVARLRSPNGLGQKWLLFRQGSHDWFSFSRDPQPYLLSGPLILPGPFQCSLWSSKQLNFLKAWQLTSKGNFHKRKNSPLLRLGATCSYGGGR